jgi:hypothetical protein
MSFEQLISTASLGDGTKPKYQSIAEDLAQAILNGQVPMGEKLPPSAIWRVAWGSRPEPSAGLMRS